MATLPLHFRDRHLFVETGGALWLLDTGAPTSFGTNGTVTLATERFQVGDSYLGLTAETLSGFIGVDCSGLLGADVLDRFDFLLDAPGGKVGISTTDLEFGGAAIPMNKFMGIPVVSSRIRGADYRMVFDTGAQISYLQTDELRTSFPAAGRVRDFYPGVGQFETDTCSVEVALGDVEFTLRCGALPGLLGATLLMAGAEGIIGNEMLGERVVGYFPRRRLLVL